jgi:signal peptide peptidase SppA
MSRLMTLAKEIWAGSFLSYTEFLEAKGKMDAAPPEAEMQAQAYYLDAEDDEDERQPYQGYGYMVDTFGSVASVSVSGKLVTSSSWLSRMFGMTGYDEIQGAVSAAAQEPGIDNVLLDIDSPGGSVSGVAETSDMIKAIDGSVMPVSAFTSGQMASAAYWLGSAAREIHATEMASVGSIGVIAVHQEYSKAMEKEGVKPTVFTAGKYKGVGNPYEPLSAEDKEYIQAHVDDAYGFFISAVAENRGLTADYVRENSADGKDFYAKEAISVGLVDRINSFQDVVKLLDSSHNPTQAVPQGGI